MKSRAAGTAYLAPLGLSSIESPSVKPYVFGLLNSGQAVMPEGAAVVEGSRRGRQVHVETN